MVSAWEAEVNKVNSFVEHVSKIRIGLVLAKEGGALLPLAIPTSFGLGAWFGMGTQWQSWIHIEDLCSAHLLAMCSLINGVKRGALAYNLGNGQGYSVQQVIETVEAVVAEDGCSLTVKEGVFSL